MAESGGCDDPHNDIGIAPSVPSQPGNAVSGHPVDCPCLSTLLYVHFQSPVKAGNLDMSAQGSSGKAYVMLHKEIFVVSFEQRMFLDVYHYVQVAGARLTGPALPRHTDAVAGIRSCRHFDLDSAQFFDGTLPPHIQGTAS